MRVPLKELMEKLNVGYELSPYETCPWMFYDTDKGITCSAEVRVGPGGSDIEAEVQFMMDDDAPYEEGEEHRGTDDTGRIGSVASGIALGSGEDIEEHQDLEEEKIFSPLKPGMQQQIFYMLILPFEDDWQPKKLFIKGQDYVNALSGWEEKGCEVFTLCTQSILMEELPDIEALVNEKMQEDDARGGYGGRVGRKSPKVNTSALLGVKKPM